MKEAGRDGVGSWRGGGGGGVGWGVGGGAEGSRIENVYVLQGEFARRSIERCKRRAKTESDLKTRPSIHTDGGPRWYVSQPDADPPLLPPHPHPAPHLPAPPGTRTQVRLQ